MKDPGALVAGLAVMALGALLLLAQLDVIELGFGYAAPAVFATAGAALLAFGLTRRG
jgi:hypothetical protein